VTSLLLIALAALPVVEDGKPRLRLEDDGSPAARAAAELLQRHVVLLARTALPTEGDAPPLRIESGSFDGYRIEPHEGGMRITGRFPTLAVFDLLRSWGCRFEGDEPHLPKRDDLDASPVTWRNDRPLYVEADGVDPLMPATGVAVAGLRAYEQFPAERAHALGYRIRVASTSFDDFLPVTLFERHPEWFALRRGARHPRGNFALTNAAAREAYLDRAGQWLAAHPEVDRLGLWPEVTTVWCEESRALGPAEAYALLWREAAQKFPRRRFEILATGPTLKPPEGRVPENVDVRVRPGREASALQGVAGQAIDAVVRAWEVRGARVVLEMDGAPESWCGLPWPDYDAVRANAQRGVAAVLRHPDRRRATLWHDPKARVEIDEEMARLLTAARAVRSWGDPADAAELWTEPGESPGARAGEVERLRRRAMRPDLEDPERREAATRAWFAFGALAHDLGPAYRRGMERAMRRLLEEVLPDGAETKVGPATVRETFDVVSVETSRLRLVVRRRDALVESVQRRHGTEWSRNVLGDAGRAFSVVALGERSDRTDGSVRVVEGDGGAVCIELAGRTHARGSRWLATLTLSDDSTRVRQDARVEAAGGIAGGFRFAKGTWDEWICPSYAREGRFEHPKERRQASFRLVPDEPLYVRTAPRGLGVALILPEGGVAAIVDGEDGSLLATSPGNRLVLDWVIFESLAELR